MLQDGLYLSSLSPTYLIQIEGKVARYENLANIGVQQTEFYVGPCNYGKFGKTHPDVKAKTGQEFYDIVITFMDGVLKMYAVSGKDGKSLTMMGFYKEVETYNWMSMEELMAFKNGCDPANAPSTPYKIQPEYQGKLIWMTGAPGAGKTTTAFTLAKKAGFVYFEADCVLMHSNPYVPLDVESPAGAFFKQPPLKVSGNHFNLLLYFAFLDVPV